MLWVRFIQHVNSHKHALAKRGHVCPNMPVISLGVTAEHTRPCDDKQRGLSCPRRIQHKHQSDQPHFARGSLHLLVNESNKCASVVKNFLPFLPLLTAPLRGLSPRPSRTLGNIAKVFNFPFHPDYNNYKRHGRKIMSSTRGRCTFL